MAEKAPGRSPARPRAKPRARYHHGDLRDALLDAALGVVRRDGLDAVKLKDLSASLKVSVAAPFRHFESREALLVELAERCATQMVAALEAAAAAHAADGPLEAQRARGVAYVRFVVEEPAALRLLARPEIVAASPLLQAMNAQQAAIMEPVLGRGHQGAESPALAQRAAGFLAAQCLTFGLAQMIVSGLLGPVTPDDAERLAYELTGVLGDGLLAGAS